MNAPQKLVGEVFGIPSPKPYKGKQNPDKVTNPDLMVGMELEVENLPHGMGWYQDHSAPFWTVVEDGSLRPRGESWEFVSKPALLGTALAELRILVEKMKWTDRNYSDRCSVHVHTNVLDFTQEQVANLALVYPVVEAILFQYVNHHKKQEEQGYCRDTNLYCIPWSSCRMNRNFIEKFFDNPAVFVPDRRGLGVRAWEKYTALNFLPIAEHGTVEWRHMHGTADMEKLTTWLNIVGSIMKFCKENTFDDIVKTIKVLNDVSTYQQFFTAVLGGVLEYKAEYRSPMAEGVINAKYSLINWEANKGKDKTATKKSLAAEALLRPLEPDWEAMEALEDMAPENTPQPWAGDAPRAAFDGEVNPARFGDALRGLRAGQVPVAQQVREAVAGLVEQDALAAARERIARQERNMRAAEQERWRQMQEAARAVPQPAPLMPQQAAPQVIPRPGDLAAQLEAARVIRVNNPFAFRPAGPARNPRDVPPRGRR